LRGNDDPNQLIGSTGVNALFGNGGDDTIIARAGKDKVVGGLGADLMFGGAGADTFTLQALADSTFSASGRDVVFDFSVAGGDRIDLRPIDANTHRSGNQAFTWLGKVASFTGHAGDLRYVNKGGSTLVYGDVDGDRKADFAVELEGALKLLKDDFLL
jgi:Ca2+-binding RTX toxin-like protein